MSDSSDDSDDDLFMSSGLNKRKVAKEERKRAANTNLLKEALEEDKLKRQRRGKFQEILELDKKTDLLKVAEENLALSEDRKRKEEEQQREEKVDEQIVLDRKQLEAVETAKETEGSSLVGTRQGIFKRGVYKKTEKTLKQTIRKLPKNSTIRTFLECATDDIALVLEEKIIVKKFDDFPESLLNWLWEDGILDEECSDGAYETLIAYHTKSPSSSPKIKKMLSQWKQMFDPKSQKSEECRNSKDSITDITYWLKLWEIILGNNHVTLKDSQDVADMLVKLSTIVLSAQFYRSQSKIGIVWEKIICLLLTLLRKNITDKKMWQDWQIETCKRILNIDKITAPAQGSEDADDINGYLSKSLIVNAFLRAGESASDFGIELADQALRHFLCFDNWEDELAKFFIKYEWLKLKVNESAKWQRLVQVTCGFFIILTADEKIQTNPPLILACGKVLQFYTLVSLCNIADDVTNFVTIEQDAAQWLELLENQISALRNIAMKFSSNAHFRRTEVLLTHFKLLIKDTKEKALAASNEHNSSYRKPQKQSCINQWIQKNI